MGELKTKKNDSDVNEFIDSLDDSNRKSEYRMMLEIFQQLTDYQPKI